MSNIKPCDKCGWAEHGRYRPNECDPARGATAKALIAALPEVDSTMLGYGFGKVVLGRNIDEHDFSVWLDVDDGYFKWRDVTCIMHELSQDDAVDLVRTLLQWRDRCDARRSKP